MSERTFDDFDNVAKNYRAIHTANIKLSGADSFYFAEHKVLQLKEYETNISNTMLDIGCGDGATEFYIEKYFPEWAIEGVDVSEESIAVAKQKHIATANFQLYDGITMPFEDNKFDVVFIAAVLHHIDFSLHEKLLSEIYRVLKPRGRLYLFEHNPINPVTQHLVRTCEFDKDARLLSYSYTGKIIKKAGLKIAEKKFTLFFPRTGILSKLISLEKSLSWLPLGGQYYYRCIK